jgi:hypothetical protein
MSFLSTVQTVAKNYDEVYTKINQLISDNGIVDASDIEDLEIVPFGSGMFLCVLLFKQFTRWLKQTASVGEKATLGAWAFAKRATAVAIGATVLSPARKIVGLRKITTPKVGLAPAKIPGLRRVSKLGVLLAARHISLSFRKNSPVGLKIAGKIVKLNNAVVTWP